MAHRSERGNILGFVLVGALLVALLLGGIFLVRQNIANQGKGAADIAKEQDKNTDTNPDSSSDKDSQESSPDAQGDTAKDASLKEALDAQSSSNGSGAATTPATGTGSNAKALPETGPADTAIAVVGATLLVGAAAAYIGSRRLI